MEKRKTRTRCLWSHEKSGIDLRKGGKKVALAVQAKYLMLHCGDNTLIFPSKL